MFIKANAITFSVRVHVVHRCDVIAELAARNRSHSSSAAASTAPEGKAAGRRAGTDEDTFAACLCRRPRTALSSRSAMFAAVVVAGTVNFS